MESPDFEMRFPKLWKYEGADFKSESFMLACEKNIDSGDVFQNILTTKLHSVLTGVLLGRLTDT